MGATVELKDSFADASLEMDGSGERFRVAAALQTAISAHSARHAPGGVDAIATGPAVALTPGSASAPGTGAALARADHVHALPAFGAVHGSFCEGDDARLVDARLPTGPAGGQLGGTYPSPDVRGLRETAGPTLLALGAVADGQVLQRSGASIVGVSAATAPALLRADGDFNSFAAKASPISADVLLLEDSAAGFAKRKATVAALRGALQLDAPVGFAWVVNAASIDVSTAHNFAATNTLTGNSTLTLANGADGLGGMIYVKQDATGARTLAFTVAGRTVVRDLNVPDTNPLAAPSGITMYQYYFVTIAGTACVVLNKVYLQ